MPQNNLKQTDLGEFPENWEELTIQDIGDVIGGGTPSTKIEEYYIGNIAWITPKDLSNHKEVYISKGERSISETGLNKSSAKLMPPETVLFTSRAPVGYVAIAKNDVSTNQGFKSIICNTRAHNRFIYYWLKHNKDRIESMASGSTFKEVSGSTLKSIKIILPPIEEQRKIAEVLFALDSKIELLQKESNNLEAIEKAIFKQWFVDFEFPNDEGKPYKSSGGKMVESELGDIPEEWVVESISNHLEINIGGDWGSEKFEEGFIEAISLRGVDIDKLKNEGYSKDAPVRWIKENSLLKRSISDKDILIGGSGLGPIGKSIYCHNALLKKYNYPITFSNFCKRFTAKENYMAFYFEIILSRLYSQGILKQYFSGTSIPNLDSKSLLNHKVIVPSKVLMKKFYGLISEKFDKLFTNEIQILQNIRNSLLPKLMTGKIRVPLEETQ